MAEDYYKTLDVARDASPADIQAAYRKLARKYHPDMNPDDKSAKGKFQLVQKAFDVLNDPSKRELYDRYGSSFESMGAGAGAGPGPGARGGGGAWRSTGGEDIDFGQFFGDRYGGGDESGSFADIFNQFRRAGGRQKRERPQPQGGADVSAELEIPFNTAVLGGETQISLGRPDGPAETINVKIPAGIDEGKKIRLRGQGEPGPDGTRGDLLITIHVAPHPYFTRHGNNLEVRVPVTVGEAVLGAKIDVPTPKGTISLRIPPGTSSGKNLRVKGHGVAPRNGEPGDLYAEISIALPPQLDDTATDLIRKFEERVSESGSYEPRRDLRW